VDERCSPVLKSMAELEQKAWSYLESKQRSKELWRALVLCAKGFESRFDSS